MNETDDLLLDILTVCNRHKITSSQVITILSDPEFMREIVQALETTENIN